MLSQFGTAFVFLAVGFVFLAIGMMASRIIRPSNPNDVKLSTYECGEEPVGSAWEQFNIRFYVVALVFLIFEVEIVFLFPWATVFKRLGPIALIEMMVFVLILLVGLAYVWARGDLDWEKMKMPWTRHVE